MRGSCIVDFLGLRVELQELDMSGIYVAEHLTALPPRGDLVERLQEAVQRAKLQTEQCDVDESRD